MPSLEQWRANGWLLREEAKLPEIVQLFAVVDRELADANTSGLSVDGKFMHAYDAALILCMIVVRVSGYRVPKGSGHHKRAIECLPLGLGGEFQALSDEIEVASRLRGQAMYDRSGVVSLTDATSLAETAGKLRGSVIEWLQAAHPDLVPKGLSP
jgi:hypothetical protein